MSKTVPHFSGGPEIKYLLQEGVSGKESLLAKPPGLEVPHYDGDLFEPM